MSFNLAIASSERFLSIVPLFIASIICFRIALTSINPFIYSSLLASSLRARGCNSDNLVSASVKFVSCTALSFSSTTALASSTTFSALTLADFILSDTLLIPDLAASIPFLAAGKISGAAA